MRLTQRTGELVIRHGKGDRRRVVPLSPPARAALREWLADRAGHPQPAEHQERPVVDLADRRAAVGPVDLSKIVTAVMAAAGIEESAHALRHTVATRLVRDHAPRSRPGRRHPRPRRRQDHAPLRALGA